MQLKFMKNKKKKLKEK